MTEIYLTISTKTVSSGSHDTFSGMLWGCVGTSLEIPSVSRIKDKHLLFFNKYSKFFCRLATVHIHYKLIQLTYTNFANSF